LQAQLAEEEKKRQQRQLQEEEKVAKQKLAQQMEEIKRARELEEKKNKDKAILKSILIQKGASAYDIAAVDLLEVLEHLFVM
jgi:predicted  nucleic acid-binding Zn-ribbon protein